MEPRDCSWCGSALSIEYGMCQVCLMRFPETEEPEVVVVLDAESTQAADPDAPGTAVAT